MNIWILNHYAITPDMPGGTRHYDFGKELIKRGYKVTIFASSFHYAQHKELRLIKKEKYKIEKVDGMNFVWLKTFTYQKNNWRRALNMVSYMWLVYWLGKKITKINKDIEKPDIIIGSSVHLLAVFSAYWLSKYYKAKFIMEVRDLWPQTLISIGKFRRNNPIIISLQFLEKFLYQKAQRIIILPPFGVEYINSLDINRNKIIWLPNGVDLSKFYKIKPYDNKNKRYFIVMYTGSYGVADALNVILRAARIIQDKKYDKIRFLFFGDGPEKDNLLKYKQKLQIKNTIIGDSIKKLEIPDILNKANLLIYSLKKTKLYKYGLSPNKIHDYMAAGKPIIMGGDIRENIIEKVNCGISVPPENPEKMAEAIIKLYKMAPAEREKMGKGGREYVEKYHSIPVLVDKLEKVIKEVINE